MKVELRNENNNCRVIFHGQKPETYSEAIVGQFADAGIKIHSSSIKKELPEVPTTPPTVTLVITLDEYQYETMIRQAFTKEAAGPLTVIDGGTF